MSSSARYRLLVVEDDVVVGRAMARLLRATVDVFVELVPARVLERLRHGEMYDLIACDVVMPEMSGLDLFERAVDLRPDVRSRFVFLSGGVPPALKERLAATGRPFLAKPIGGDQVLALLRAEPA